jgi:hypothetical protein
MKRGSKFLIVALSTIAMAGTAAAQGDDAGGGDAGGGDAGGGDAGGGDAGGGDAGGGDAGGGDAGGGDMGGGDMGGGDMGADMGGAPPLILPKGKLGIFAAIGVGLSKDLAGKPIDIAPDIWYGVMPKLEAGIVHSGYGLTGFWGDNVPLGIVGLGICVTGTDGGCAKVYDGPIGVLAHYQLLEGGIDLAADAGVVLGSFDPFQIGVKVGVRGRKMMGKLAIHFAPNVGIQVTERADEGNETLSVPVDVHFMVSPKLGVGVQTGIQGEFSSFGDNFRIPVSLGAMFQVTPAIMAGASFNLHRVAGFDGPGAADLRSLTVFLGWHN